MVVVSTDGVNFAERKALEDEIVDGDEDEGEDDARYLNLEGEEDGNRVCCYPCRLLTQVFRGCLGRGFRVS